MLRNHRRFLILAALVTSLCLASASDALAQNRNGGKGNWGGGGNWNGGRGGNWNGGRGYYGPGIGIGIGLGMPYYGGYGYGTPAYYNDPANYYVAPSIGVAPNTATSYYPAQNSTAVLNIRLPQNARLFFGDSEATGQSGAVRQFASPPLEPGSTYQYQLRAQWMENGQSVDRTRTVNVRSGESVNVDFFERN